MLPNRLTQMYADTKRSYEQIVRTNITNPQLSSLHLKLRIQKDRLFAWGLEWADANAAQADDIDSSLDRAGISDLVASIMSSIRELLEEAERIQPSSHLPIPGAFSDTKSGIFQSINSPWTSNDLARLGDIVKDMTVSIDTLCDLSRSQQMLGQQPHGQREKRSSPVSPGSNPEGTSDKHDLLPSKTDYFYVDDSDQYPSKFASATRISPHDLVYPEKHNLTGQNPPSYETSATDPGNRVFAYFNHQIPVLVDYGFEGDIDADGATLPFPRRYENLILALQGSPNTHSPVYTGSLRILGWFLEIRQAHSRYAIVYELPNQPPLSKQPQLSTNSPPRTLLSYLQHSADTDSGNMPCLEDRFRLALNLASNLLHCHAKGLTHRNINSNNVVFAAVDVPNGAETKPWKEGVIRKPFLVSWDQSDKDALATPQETFISNIYRYPGIERGQRSAFRPEHDIYSLGLILTEIGIWMPLNKLWKTKYTRADFKSRLQAIYTQKLAVKCGTAYMRAAQYCLRAAEFDQWMPKSSRDSPPKTQNDYYWKVVKPLQRCCMIDDLDEPTVVAASSASVLPPAVPEKLPTTSDMNNNQATAREKLAESVTEPTEGMKSEERTFTASHMSDRIPQKTLTADSITHRGQKLDVLVWSYEIPESTRTYFNTVVVPKLSLIFSKVIDRWESYELDVFMAGETPESARPTLMMVCDSIKKAWVVLQHVNKEKGLFDIRVASGQISYSKPGKKRSKAKKSGGNIRGGASRTKSQTSRFQQMPSCGASISCFVEEQNLEPVTFGGIVLVDGEAHGMSVHHMLEDQDADSGYDDDAGSSPVKFPSISGFSEDAAGSFGQLNLADGEEEDLLSAIQEAEARFHPASYQSEDGRQLTDQYAQHGLFSPTTHTNKEDINLGDTLGIEPGQGNHIIVTQPALDDVDPGFFPNEDEMCDTHLIKHGMGSVYASSGLRRLTHGKIPHEVDWALFQIYPERKQFTNVVAGGAKHCKKATHHSYPSQVLKADALGGLRVHAFGSKSGLGAGKISPDMVLTKMPGRAFPAPIWRTEGDFGVGGDSGAWVIDNETGGVCGHVTGYSERFQSGTISAMEVLLHDMEQTLGKPVALPSPTGVTPASFKEQILVNEADDPGSEVDRSYRRWSVDSNYSSDTEPDDDDNDVATKATDHAQRSPPLPTSPPQPSSLQVSNMNLTGVAEQWRATRRSLDGAAACPEKGKQMKSTSCYVRGGLEARV